MKNLTWQNPEQLFVAQELINKVKSKCCGIKVNIKVMAVTVLNSTQVHLLQMFQVDDSQKGLEELKELLFSYYSKKMDESLNELWDSGVLDQKRLDQINNMDLHKLEMSWML